MEFRLLPLLLLLVLTKASPTPPWIQQLLPECIPSFSKDHCAPFITPKVLKGIPKHLHDDLYLLQKDFRENEDLINEFSTNIDDLIAQDFSFRTKVTAPSKFDLEQQEVMIRKIVDKAFDYLSRSRPQATSKKQKSKKNSQKSSREREISKAYYTCVGNNYRANHMNQLKIDLLQSASSHAVVQIEEFRAKILSAARADLARVSAHRMKCFAAIEERIKITEASTSRRNELMDLSSTQSAGLENNFKIIDKNLEEAGKELADWRTRQTEIVKHLFDDLLNQKSQTAVLQSQENRLNALVQLVRMEKTYPVKAKTQFQINTNNFGKLHPEVQTMMKEYLRCVGSPIIQWSSETRRELAMEVDKILAESEESKLAKETTTLEYFWGRHFIRIYLDFANAIADSIHCYERTERRLFYKDAHIK